MLRITLPCASLALLPALLSAAGIRPGDPDDPSEDYVRRARIHYDRAETELRAADVANLSAEQRAARRAALDALAVYRERGVFGASEDPRGRLPLFVDGAGRRCAVAELLHVTGNDELVARIAAEDNNVWVAQLGHDREVGAWLDAHGLSLREAARVQLPPGGVFINFGPGGWQEALTWGLDSPTRPPDGGATPSRPPSPDAPVGGGWTPVTTGPVGPSAGPRGAPGTPLFSAPPEPWWVFWEMNKSAYLQPNRLLPSAGPATESGVPFEYPGAALDRLRGNALPLFAEHLASEVAVVRAAAAVALGRVGGADVVPALVARLDDGSLFVRDSAILALGATASDAGAAVLRELAVSGTAHARPYAIVALGLARAGGWNDPELPVLFDEALEGLRGVERDDAELALLLHRALARAGHAGPDAALDVLAAGALEDTRAGLAVRTRAIEELAWEHDTESLATLSDFTTARRSELRQAAAMGLGAHGSDLALPVLQTAYEMEKEPVARGMLLVSIGRRGGDEARIFLADVLADGPRATRPWAALALGLAAGHDDDDAARTTLREAFAREKSAEARAAFLIAMGIARDTFAAPLLARELAESARAEIRMHAALGLALCRGAGARAALLAALQVEDDPLTRVTIAQGIGLLGDPRDADVLLGVLRAQRGAELQGLASIAAGLSGSRAVHDGLLELLADDGSHAGARAAALDALGLMLARRPGLLLGGLAHQSSTTPYPDWAVGLLRFTL